MFVCEKEKNEVEIKEQKPQINSIYTIFVYFEPFLFRSRRLRRHILMSIKWRIEQQIAITITSLKKRSEADRHAQMQPGPGNKTLTSY